MILARRFFLIVLGLVTTGLAVAGTFIPGLPTTVFLLIALWAFAESNQKLHMWLQRLPLLRHGLREAQVYKEKREIRRSIKWIAQGAAWGSLGTALLASFTLIPVLLIFLAAASCSVFMFFTKTAE